MGEYKYSIVGKKVLPGYRVCNCSNLKRGSLASIHSIPPSRLPGIPIIILMVSAMVGVCLFINQ
jgi:hypothetical protein